MQRSRRSAPTVAFALGLLVVLAGCTAAATPSPAVISPTPADASPSPVTSATVPPSAQPSAKASHIVSVAWGPIWDTVPAHLPLPAGTVVASPADPSIGAASAIYTTPLQPAAAVAWLKTAFVAAGYTVEGIASGEDGSVALSLDGRGSCRIMLTVKPLGSVRFLSVYYGADCPKP